MRTQSGSAHIVTAPTAKTLVYTGEAQELVTPSSAVGGTMMYRVTDGAARLTDGSDDDAYSARIPTVTDAGTYTVWYRVDGDSGYNDIPPQSIPVTIRKASQAAPEKGMGYVFADATLMVDTESTNANAKNQTHYELYDGADAPIASGAYTLESGKTYYARWGGSENYNASPYTVIPTEISVTVLEDVFTTG